MPTIKLQLHGNAGRVSHGERLIGIQDNEFLPSAVVAVSAAAVRVAAAVAAAALHQGSGIPTGHGTMMVFIVTTAAMMAVAVMR